MKADEVRLSHRLKSRVGLIPVTAVQDDISLSFILPLHPCFWRGARVVELAALEML